MSLKNQNKPGFSLTARPLLPISQSRKRILYNWSEEVILVNLATEPDMGDELQTVIDLVVEDKTQNVVVDFIDTDIITSSSIAKLLKLRKVLHDNGRTLVFSSVKPKTRSIFNVTGLESVFDFIDDQFIALASLQLVN
ncbi:MAG: STAS domain-containing protein [Planctomycetota bacterium]